MKGLQRRVIGGALIALAVISGILVFCLLREELRPASQLAGLDLHAAANRSAMTSAGGASLDATSVVRAEVDSSTTQSHSHQAVQIKGRVFAADGYVVRSVVTLETSPSAAGTRSVLATSTCDEEGRFEFVTAAIDVGDVVRLTAKSPSFRPHYEDIDVASTDVAGVECALFRIGTSDFDGRFVDPTGKPLSFDDLIFLFGTQGVGRATGRSVGNTGTWVSEPGEFRRAVAVRASIDLQQSSFRAGIPDEWGANLVIHTLRQDVPVAVVTVGRSASEPKVVVDVPSVRARSVDVVVRAISEDRLPVIGAVRIAARSSYFCDEFAEVSESITLSRDGAAFISQLAHGDYVVESMDCIGGRCVGMTTQTATGSEPMTWFVRAEPTTVVDVSLTEESPGSIDVTASARLRVRAWSESGLEFPCSFEVLRPGELRVSEVPLGNAYVAVGVHARAVTAPCRTIIELGSRGTVRLEVGPFAPTAGKEGAALAIECLLDGRVDVLGHTVLSGALDPSHIFRSHLNLPRGRYKLRMNLGGGQFHESWVDCAPDTDSTVAIRTPP